jgi:hypothetical protein
MADWTRATAGGSSFTNRTHVSPKVLDLFHWQRDGIARLQIEGLRQQVLTEDAKVEAKAAEGPRVEGAGRRAAVPTGPGGALAGLSGWPRLQFATE